MQGKILISTTLIVKTGLHIGGTEGFSAIGAIDNPVIRDTVTGKPIIPGSSLKGKLRSLIAKYVYDSNEEVKSDPIEVKRLFGAMSPEFIESRLQFSDAFIDEQNSVRGLFEVKTETAIDRKTGSAKTGSLRQIERVVAGTKFKVEIIYNCIKDDEIKIDIDNILEGLKLLTWDYLGGSGTRGYGRVEFDNLSISVACGDIDQQIISELNNKILSN